MEFFTKRTILAPLDRNVDEINNYMLQMVPGEEKEYVSVDRAIDSYMGATVSPE